MAARSAKSTKNFRTTDWYSISVETIRRMAGFGVAAIIAVLAFFGYRQWDNYWTHQSSFEWVARAEVLLSQVSGDTSLEPHRNEIQFASERLNGAREALGAGDFRRALSLGRESHGTLQRLLDELRLRESVAWFRSVRGDVRFRRGDGGEFLRAFPRVELHDGDYVRASDNASAELHFRADETIFTLRPGSLIKISRQLSSQGRTLGHMEYGWVAMDTGGMATGVTTARAEVMVSRNSQASVDVDARQARSTVRVETGAADVRSVNTGEQRRLAERQQLTQVGDQLGDTVDLPPAPELLGPSDGRGVNIDNTDRVELSWKPSPGAAGYAVQVSRSRLFEQLLVDERSRSKARLTLGLREEGTYLWRVAAANIAGDWGPWSDPRRIRVDSYRNLAIEPDLVAPEIAVEVLLSGSLAVLRGHTEPGARLDVNGTPIPLAADGTFATTYAVGATGRVALDFRAVDTSGNGAKLRRWVYVEEG